MKTRKLGRSGPEITVLGFGAWAAGGQWKFGWGSQKDSESLGAIHRALELGENWIDTAPAYGLGHSEELVGRAVREWSGPRPYIFTKCGIVWDDRGRISYSLAPDSVRRECEASLRRLGTDVIDLYQIHWPADELRETLDGFREIVELQREGKVRWIGVSNFSVPELEEAAKIDSFTSVQPPYSLIRRESEHAILPWCQAHGVGAIVYSPMESGLLTGAMTRERIDSLPPDDWRKTNERFREPALSHNLEVAERVKSVAARHHASPGEIALAWILRNPGVSGAIVGGRSARQVEGIIHAPEIALNEHDVAELEGRRAAYA